MHFLYHEEKEKWIEDYVERETTLARKQVQDAETAIMEVLEDMTTGENVGVTTGKPETMFEAMMNAIRDSLSDLGSSNDEQDGKDKEDDKEDTEHGKLSNADEPGWLMGSISKTVQNGMVRFWQKQIRLEQLTQPGCGDAAGYFHKWDMKYVTAELKVPAVVKPQMDTSAATSCLTTFGEHT